MIHCTLSDVMLVTTIHWIVRRKSGAVLLNPVWTIRITKLLQWLPPAVVNVCALLIVVRVVWWSVSNISERWAFIKPSSFFTDLLAGLFYHVILCRWILRSTLTKSFFSQLSYYLQEFYTLAWTTVEMSTGHKTNLLAAAGKLREIRLLHPEQLVCYAEMRGHKDDIACMIFHPTKPTILFSGDSKVRCLCYQFDVKMIWKSCPTDLAVFCVRTHAVHPLAF